MNRDKIIELMENGATFDWNEEKFYHVSFRKGWRKMRRNNISWQAVNRMHGVGGTNRLVEENEIIRLV
tara:strand:+ start:68 stop:271 length:204 start_codon:yes stop_codon:yes gene_type:complete